MRSLCLVIFMCCATIISAQNLIQNTIFSKSKLEACYGDTLNQTGHVPNWEFYQTIDDNWDGPVDSSVCIDVTSKSYGAYVDVVNIDTARRVYIRQLIDSTKNKIMPDFMYDLDAYIKVPGQVNVNKNDSFGDPLSFIAVGVEIPGSVSGGKVIRWSKSEFEKVRKGEYEINYCLPSEKFNEQRLKYFYLSLKLDSIDIKMPLELREARLESFYDFEKVKSIKANYYNSKYSYSFGNSWGHTFLMLYPDTTYPSSNAYSYVPVFPGDNSATDRQNIAININYYSTVAFQPYTDLRGAELKDSPGVYHNLIITNDGGTMCLRSAVDKVFIGGDKFIYNSGDIRFGNRSSCMQFKSGSELIVKSGAILNYGSNNGQGILLLRDKATITIEKNATLNLFNNVILREEDPEQGPGQFYVTLNPGATLRFMSGARLTNRNSHDSTIMMNVIMKGGFLDDSGLPETDKKLINRIYEPSDFESDRLRIYPNPVKDKIEFTLVAAEPQATVFQLTDLEGKLIFEKSLQLQKGINRIEIDAPDLPAGILLVNMLADHKMLRGKVMKAGW